MISDLKPYSDYKDTKQLWLGKIPAHWKLLPNRALFQDINDKNNPD